MKKNKDKETRIDDHDIHPRITTQELRNEGYYGQPPVSPFSKGDLFNNRACFFKLCVLCVFATKEALAVQG